jgi:hypothetical protein
MDAHVAARTDARPARRGQRARSQRAVRPAAGLRRPRARGRQPARRDRPRRRGP